jgi:hypothetical protein
MKTPRVTDFYPDAKVSKLKSSLDQMPAIEKPPHAQTPVTQVLPVKTVAPRLKTDKSPISRDFIKRTFDIYTDQLEFLRKLALQDRLNGSDGSMNAMVREALDQWIEKTKKSNK